MNESGDAAIAQQEKGVCERLAHVLRGRSQVEVARKLNVPQANVYRYLKGAKIPTGFCSLVAREFGVNPTWLLLGEGSPDVSGIANETAHTAAGLLELVRAMSAITRMKLGALAGKENVRVLRELNDALVAYERLRTRLHEQTRPILETLLDEAGSLTKVSDISAKERILKAAQLLLRLCDDQRLHIRFKAQAGAVEFAKQHFETALDHHREAMLAHVVLGVERGTKHLDATFLLDGIWTFVLDLIGSGFVTTSRRTALASLALFEEYRNEPSYQAIEFLWHLSSDEQATSVQAFPMLMRLYSRLDTKFQNHFGGEFRLCRLVHGVATTEEFMDGDDKRLHEWIPDRRYGAAHYMLGYAVWSENLDTLKRTQAIYVHHKAFQDRQDGIVESEQRLLRVTQARCLNAIMESRSNATAALKDFHASWPGAFGKGVLPVPMKRLADVFLCQLLRVAGKTKEAKRRLFELEEVLRTTPQELRGLWQALHDRNTLLLLDEDDLSPRTKDMRMNARRRLHKLKRCGWDIPPGVSR